MGFLFASQNSVPCLPSTHAPRLQLACPTAEALPCSRHKRTPSNQGANNGDGAIEVTMQHKRADGATRRLHYLTSQKKHSTTVPPQHAHLRIEGLARHAQVGRAAAAQASERGRRTAGLGTRVPDHQLASGVAPSSCKHLFFGPKGSSKNSKSRVGGIGRGGGVGGWGGGRPQLFQYGV